MRTLIEQMADDCKGMKMEYDAELATHSFLRWVFSALGVQYTFLLPLAALVCFAMVLVIVLRGKGPLAAAALVLIAHVPLLIGIFAAIEGLVNSYTVIATSGGTPKPAEVAMGISTALVAPLAALLLMVPSYATAAIGAFIRALRDDDAPRTAK